MSTPRWLVHLITDWVWPAPTNIGKKTIPTDAKICSLDQILEEVVSVNRLSWLGHVVRMALERLPYYALSSSADNDEKMSPNI